MKNSLEDAVQLLDDIHLRILIRPRIVWLPLWYFLSQANGYTLSERAEEDGIHENEMTWGL